MTLALIEVSDGDFWKRSTFPVDYSFVVTEEMKVLLIMSGYRIAKERYLGGNITGWHYRPTAPMFDYFKNRRTNEYIYKLPALVQSRGGPPFQLRVNLPPWATEQLALQQLWKRYEVDSEIPTLLDYSEGIV